MRHGQFAVVLLPALLVVSTAVLMQSTAPVFGVTMVTAAQDVAAVEAALGLDRLTQRLIQQGLGNEGFDPGMPDGLFGPRTRDAIRRWQEARGVPATGYLDSEQAELLRAAGAPPPVATSAAAPAEVADCEAWNTQAFFETATAQHVTACVAAGADVAARDDSRHTPLHWAASDNENPAVLEALLSAGADLTARNEDGFTPAHLAARHNSNAAVVQFLVAAEAELAGQSSPGREGDTPAAQATATGQLPPDILLDSYLLRAEQSVRAGDDRGAQRAMDQLIALQEEHDLVPVTAYHYRYARVWNAVGAWDQALASVRRYLQLAGRDGEHYLEALTVMNAATAEIEERERESERRAAEEARRRAAEERARLEMARRVSAAAAMITHMEFVAIPAGEFRMGSDSSEPEFSLLRPATEVRITRPFQIGKYEVTQSQWETVMGSNPSYFSGCALCPVEQITWDEIHRFISFLNAADSGTWTYRLPTEAEWEYAARAGASGDHYVQDVDASAWCPDNSDEQTHPVGQKRPNGFGLHDMLGNVSEVVQDWLGTYPGGTVVDPGGPSWPTLNIGIGNPDKVTRGGSYFFPQTECEFAGRSFFNMASETGGGGIRGASWTGFRLVRTAS